MGHSIATSSTESKTRRIEVADNKIIYTLKCDGAKDYMTFDETLYTILCMDRLKPFRDEGRLRIRVRHGGVEHNFYLYDVALACYEGKIREDYFLEDMQVFLSYKNRYALTVDHVDGHANNNTALNLSLMPNTQNLSKGSMIARVRTPALLVACYSGGVYRVHYERREITSNILLGDMNALLNKRNAPLVMGFPAITIAQDYICNGTDSFLSCLHSIANSGIYYRGKVLASPMRTGGRWTAPKGKSYLDDVMISIRAQEELALLPIEKFQTWSK